jgi:hypothetical protein
MLHVWLIPALILFALVVLGFYLVVRYQGGSGARTEGRTLLDKPEDQSPPEE